MKQEKVTSLTQEQKEAVNHAGNEAATWYWARVREDVTSVTVERACIRAAKNALASLPVPDKTDRSSPTEVRNAFVKLHQDWLGASHRNDMNEAMDALATALQLDPLTLRPINDKKQFESSEPEPVKHEKEENQDL